MYYKKVETLNEVGEKGLLSVFGYKCQLTRDAKNPYIITEKYVPILTLKGTNKV